MVGVTGLLRPEDGWIVDVGYFHKCGLTAGRFVWANEPTGLDFLSRLFSSRKT